MEQLQLDDLMKDTDLDKDAVTVNGIVYDVEIINHIGPYESDRTIQCCSGWSDYKGMGISVIGVYDFVEARSRVFLKDNIREFQWLVDSREHIIGYNSSRFDDKLCAAHGIRVATTFDICTEIKRATNSIFRSGYSLDRVAKATMGIGKSEDGAIAPVLWQQGLFGSVIDYCLQDVNLERILFILSQVDQIVDPNTGRYITGIRRIATDT